MRAAFFSRKGDNWIRFFLSILLLFGFLHDASAQEPSAQDKKEETQGLTSLQKSLLIPGWGQLAEKRYAEGLFFLAAEAFSIYQIVRFNHKGNFYYDRYRGATSVNDAVRFRDLTEDYDKKRNLFLVAAVGIWAVNLLDIYVIVKNKQKLRLQLQRVGKKGLSLSLFFSF